MEDRSADEYVNSDDDQYTCDKYLVSFFYPATLEFMRLRGWNVFSRRLLGDGTARHCDNQYSVLFHCYSVDGNVASYQNQSPMMENLWSNN